MYYLNYLYKKFFKIKTFAAVVAFLFIFITPCRSKAETSDFLDKKVDNFIMKPLIIPIFTKDLKFGMVDDEVQFLQEYLNNHGYAVNETGPGSKGKETTKFGAATKAAVIKFQKANKLPATGFFGPKTRGVVGE